MSQLIDIDHVYQIVSEIVKELVVPVLPIESGGTGVTTLSDLRKLTIGLKNPLTRGAANNFVISDDDFQRNIEGDQNFIACHSALKNLTTGKANIAIGYTAGNNLVSGSQNIIMGYEAARTVTSVNEAIIIGHNALKMGDKIGAGITAIGQYAMSNAHTREDGLFPEYVTAVGLGAGGGDTVFCNRAVLIGDNAGANVPDRVHYTVCVGCSAGMGCGNIYRSVLAGVNAGKNSANIQNSVGIGNYVMWSQSGEGEHRSTHVGTVAIGEFAVDNLGSRATLYRNVIGVGNHTMRYHNFDELINAVGIGYNVGVSGSNQFQLGNSDNTVYAYGSIQNRSDERDKANIRDIEYPYKEFILGLRPVTFQWDYREDYRTKPDTSDDESETPDTRSLGEITHDGSHTRSRRHNGFIAQEVKTLMDSLGFDFAGYQDHSVNGGDDVLSLGYTEFIPPIIKLLQDVVTRLDAMESENQKLRDELQKIKS